jgi:hypothetical protein
VNDAKEWTTEEIEAALREIDFSERHKFFIYRKLKIAMREQKAAELSEEDLKNVAGGVNKNENPQKNQKT